MAATFTVTSVQRAPGSIGDRRAWYATIACAGTYTTGGDSLDLVQLLGMAALDLAVFESAGTDGTTALVPVFDRTNKKLKFFGGAASGVFLAEAAAASSLTSYSVRVMAIGQ